MKDSQYLWRDVPAGVLCWHIHHGTLLEWSSEPLDNRAAYIRAWKPSGEIETRLERMRPVQGKLPDALVKAWAAYRKAGPTFDKALLSYRLNRSSVGNKQRDTLVDAHRAYHESWLTYDKASVDNAEAINALHAAECPDCPWDGETLFPENKDD